MPGPFFHRGDIRPEHKAAWQAMVPHRHCIDGILSEILRNPPGYANIKAPRRSGKTTLVRQLVQFVGTNHKHLHPAVLHLGPLAAATSESAVVTYIDTQLSQIPGLKHQVTTASPLDFYVLPSLLHDLLYRLGNRKTLLLILDAFDSMPDHLQDGLLATLRSIHSTRDHTPLERLAVVICTTQSLEQRPHELSVSQYDIARDVELPDWDKASLEQFLIRCRSHGARDFTQSAIDCLFNMTLGQARTIQVVCEIAWRESRDAPCVDLPHVLEAIANECSMPNIPLGSWRQYSKDEKQLLIDLLKGERVCLHARHAAASNLLCQGVIKLDDYRRPVFRSPLVQLQCASVAEVKIGDEDLAPIEKQLIAIPHVRVLVLNQPLKCQVLAHIRQTGAVTSQTDFVASAVTVLRNTRPNVDMHAIRFFYSREFQVPFADAASSVSEAVIFGVAAKIWYSEL